MDVGGLLIIYIFMMAVIVPVALWIAFFSSKEKKKSTRGTLLFFSISATVVSVALFTFVTLVFIGSRDSTERQEEKTVSFDNGDSFKIEMSVEYIWIKGERICNISIYNEKGMRCAYYHGPYYDKNMIAEKWDDLKLVTNEEDLVCYETPWCVIYRKNNGGLVTVKNEEYETYRERVSVYEKVKGIK